LIAWVESRIRHAVVLAAFGTTVASDGEQQGSPRRRQQTRFERREAASFLKPIHSSQV
jgi:hypothetical protein